MSTGLDIELLRRRLEGRFGLALASGNETIDGGQFPTLRPSDLALGNGFCIVLARTHRQIEASFRADNFSAGLLRRMCEADEQSRHTFSALLEQARSDGAPVYLAVNDEALTALPDSTETWRRLELDVARRLPIGRYSSDELADQALLVASTCLSLALALLPIEEGEAGLGENIASMPEGARIRVEVNRYERSPANRATCIAHFGPVCQACGFNFSVTYGELGEGYIEVHHRTPVSQMGPNYFVNPIKDLVPVCGNCHSMLHRSNPPMEVDDLRELLRIRRTNILGERAHDGSLADTPEKTSR